MNVEDQITYIALKDLSNQTKDHLDCFRQVLKKVNQVDPSSTHIVADTLRLDDFEHNQFLNCRIELKNKVTPVPNVKIGKGNAWVTKIGKLELKRLENDYKK